MNIYLKESDQFKGVTLQALADVSNALTRVSREAYRNLNKLSKKRSPELSIQITKSVNGSLSLDLICEVLNSKDAAQLLLGTVSAVNPIEIFEHVKIALKFWEIYSSMKKEGKNPTVQITGDNNGLIIVGDNIKLSNIQFKTAVASRPAGELMAKAIQRNELKLIELGKDSGEHLLIDKGNANCFTPDLDIDEKLVDYHGEIIEFNKATKKGRFNDSISNQKFPFEVSTDALMTKTIDCMKKKKCKIRCASTYISSPTGERRTVSLIINNILDR